MACLLTMLISILVVTAMSKPVASCPDTDTCHIEYLDGLPCAVCPGFRTVACVAKDSWKERDGK